jgi:hypothetical protein
MILPLQRVKIALEIMKRMRHFQFMPIFMIRRWTRIVISPEDILPKRSIRDLIKGMILQLLHPRVRMVEEMQRMQGFVELGRLTELTTR